MAKNETRKKEHEQRVKWLMDHGASRQAAESVVGFQESVPDGMPLSGIVRAVDTWTDSILKANLTSKP